MTLKQLEELDALADGASQTGHALAWDHFVDACLSEQSSTISNFVEAADPATVKQLIKALRKMADGYAKETFSRRMFATGAPLKDAVVASKAAELIAEALED